MYNWRFGKVAIVLIIATISLAMFGVSKAAYNPQINYQGKLTNNSDAAVADGVYNMQFQLCADDGCSSVLWTETRTSTNQVQVTNGLFSVLLGSVTALGDLNFNQDLYLEMQVSDSSTTTMETLLPRKKLGTVPSAFEAGKLGGLASASYAKLATNETVTATWTFSNILSITANSASPALNILQSGAGTGISVGNGTATTTIYGNATSTFPYGATFATTGGRVGIGTLTPSAALDIGNGGSLKLTGGDSSGEGNIQMGAAASNSYDTNLIYMSSSSMTGGYMFGATPAFSNANGPYFGGRGNTFTANVSPQRGNLFFAAGSPTSPASTEGVIKFITGSAETLRMIINNDGNIGIGTGTAVPSEKLDFATTGLTDTSSVRFGINNGIASGLGTDFGGGLIWKTGYGNGYTKKSAGILQTAEGNYFRSGLAFFTNGVSDQTTDWSERMRIDMNGKVGIGTSTPASQLQVLATTEQLRLNYDSTKYTSFTVGSNGAFTLAPSNTGTTTKFQITDAGLAASNSEILNLKTQYNTGAQKAITWRDANNITGQIDTRYNGATVDMVFGHLYDGVVPTYYSTTDVMTLKSSGRVGIGTSTPAYLLDVYATTGVSQGRVYTNDITSYAQQRIEAGTSAIALAAFGSSFSGSSGVYQTSSVAFQSSAVNGFSLVNEHASGFISFVTAGYAVANERMRVTNDGKVGIGTTAPADKLHVVGSLRVSDSTNTNLYFKVTNSQITTYPRTLFQGGSATTDSNWLMRFAEAYSSSTKNIPVGIQLSTNNDSGYVNAKTLVLYNTDTYGYIGTASGTASDGMPIFLTTQAAMTTPGLVIDTVSNGQRVLIGGLVAALAPVAKLQVGTGNVGEPGQAGSLTPVVRIVGASNTISGEDTLLRLVRDTNSSNLYGAVVDFKMKSYNSAMGSPYLPKTQMTIALKSTGAYAETANVDVLTLRDNGYVGIGTTSPLAILHLNSDSSTSTIFQISTTSNSNIFLVKANGRILINTSSYMGATSYKLVIDSGSETGYGLGVRGIINATSLITGSSTLDIAETYPINSQCYADGNCPEKGDLVCTDSSLNSGIKKCSNLYDNTVVGIVSTDPGLLLGGGDFGNLEDNASVRKVALAGRVPTKVSTVNGAIMPGDKLTSSDIPGVAMKATAEGSVVGIAMESYSGSSVGSIVVFVNVGWNNTIYRALSVNDVDHVLKIGDDQNLISLKVTGDTSLNKVTAHDIIPETDSTYDLGTSSYRWKNVWSQNLNVVSSTFSGSILVNTTTNVNGYKMVIDAGGAGTNAGLGVNGYIKATSFITGTTTLDLAETYPVDPSCAENNSCPVAGDVVCTKNSSSTNVYFVEKCSELSSDKSIGVISTAPGMILGGSGLNTADSNSTFSRLVALAGRVPVSVVISSGTINVGDGITASDVAGYATKAKEPGRVIGFALTSLSSNGDAVTTGTVEIFVNPHWSIGSLTEADIPETLVTSTSSTSTPTVLDKFSITVKYALSKLGMIVKDGFLQVKEFFAEKIHTNELCIGNTCVTEAQLQDLLQKNQIAAPAVGSTDGGNITSGDATSSSTEPIVDTGTPTSTEPTPVITTETPPAESVPTSPPAETPPVETVPPATEIITTP